MFGCWSCICCPPSPGAEPGVLDFKREQRHRLLHSQPAPEAATDPAPQLTLQEKRIQRCKQSLQLNNGRLYLTGVFVRANAVNTNKRVYPKEIIAAEVARFYQKLVVEGTAFGELCHPGYTCETYKELHLAAVSHQVLALWWADDKLHGLLEILDTRAGRLARQLYLQGYLFGASSRGWCSQGDSGEGDYKTVMDDLELLTFDLAPCPANHLWLYPVVREYKETHQRADAVLQRAMEGDTGVLPLYPCLDPAAQRDAWSIRHRMQRDRQPGGAACRRTASATVLDTSAARAALQSNTATMSAAAAAAGTSLQQAAALEPAQTWPGESATPELLDDGSSGPASYGQRAAALLDGLSELQPASSGDQHASNDAIEEPLGASSRCTAAGPHVSPQQEQGSRAAGSHAAAAACRAPSLPSPAALQVEASPKAAGRGSARRASATLLDVDSPDELPLRHRVDPVTDVRSRLTRMEKMLDMMQLGEFKLQEVTRKGLKHSPSQQAVLQALTKQGSQGAFAGNPPKPGSGHCQHASSGSIGPLMDLSSEQVSADNTPLLSAAAAVGLLDEEELRRAAPVKSIRQSLSHSAAQQQQGKAEPLSI